MKAQFHLPLATYPDASSFSLLQNAVAVSLHQKAGLTASIPLVRIEPFQPRFPSLIDVDKMRAEAERLSKDNGTVLGQTLRDYAKKPRSRSRSSHSMRGSRLSHKLLPSCRAHMIFPSWKHLS